MRDIKKLKIAVLKGGLSSERAISLITGKAIADELRKNGHNVVEIDINSRSVSKIEKARPDVVLNGLHGTYGEDGVMQGILEFLGIPYAGCGVMASAVAMNKIKAKEVYEFHGIKVAPWTVVEDKKGLSGIKMSYPLVFKPGREGSSVGVYIVKSRKEAGKVFGKVKKLGERVLVEKYVKGIEISVPVFGEKALPIIEIIPKNEFYDYEAKYTPGMSEHVIPARLKPDVYKRAQKIAVQAHKALECRDLSRTDMIIKGRDIYVLETNTLPGFTSVSLYPESARSAGISFYELLTYFIKSALRRK